MPVAIAFVCGVPIIPKPCARPLAIGTPYLAIPFTIFLPVFHTFLAISPSLAKNPGAIFFIIKNNYFYQYLRTNSITALVFRGSKSITDPSGL